MSAGGLDCGGAAKLLPRYLDGELADRLASGLRGHLLACRDCRGALQAERDARRWFEAQPPPVVPGGFAARVAALAALGVESEARPRDLPTAFQAALPEDPQAGALLEFTVRLVALAALALLGLSLVLALSARPAAPAQLFADPLPEVLERLDQLNRRALEAAADEAVRPTGRGEPAVR